MMKFWLLVCGMCLLSASVLAEEPRFFSQLTDIPVMPGLYELADQAVVFDKPEGRIVTVMAVSETENVNDINAFYNTALPQLGWTRVRDGVFARQDETLLVGVEAENALSVVKLMVSPR